VQSEQQWETSSDDEVVQRTTQGTQVEKEDLEDLEEASERSYTPPGTPPTLRRWGPPRLTTQPPLEWKERL